MKPQDRIQHEREAGFSLVEVLVALALSTFVVGAFQLVMVEVVHTLEAAGERARAINYANSTFAALGAEHPLTPGQVAGQYDEEVGYALEIVAEDNWRIGSSGQLYFVKLNVSWHGRDGTQSIELATRRIGGVP